MENVRIKNVSLFLPSDARTNTAYSTTTMISEAYSLVLSSKLRGVVGSSPMHGDCCDWLIVIEYAACGTTATELDELSCRKSL